MARKTSAAMQKAEKAARKPDNKLSGAEIARKFGLSTTAVYTSSWWKEIKKAKAEKEQ